MEVRRPHGRIMSRECGQAPVTDWVVAKAAIHDASTEPQTPKQSGYAHSRWAIHRAGGNWAHDNYVVPRALDPPLYCGSTSM
jgi:hypothetical protein